MTKEKEPETVSLSIHHIAPNPKNPRHDVGDVSGLAASMKEHDLLQPVIVRPIGEAFGEQFELVSGHRRFAAAKLLEWKQITAIVRPYDEREALQVAVVENLQRENLHPLDEMEAITELAKSMTHEEIAVKLGKGTAWVAQRLALARLPAEVAKAYRAGHVENRTALLIARIPNEEVRARAAEEALKPIDIFLRTEARQDTKLKTVLDHEAVAELVRARFTLRLKAAPFDRKDEQLVEGAGACGPCPKRSGNARDLFGDIQGDDVCLDTDCFAAKSEAGWKQEIEAAVAGGDVALTDEQSKKIFPHGAWISPAAGFIEPTDKANDLGLYDKEWREIIPKDQELTQFLTRDPDGTRRYLWKKEDVLAVLKEHGTGKAAKAAKEKVDGGSSASSPAAKKQKEREKAQRKKEARDREIRDRLFVKVLDVAHAGNASETAFLRTVAAAFQESWQGAKIAEQLGVKKRDVETANLKELRRIVLAFAIGDVKMSHNARKILDGAAAALKIDVKAIAKEIDAEKIEKQNPEKKTKKKAA